MKFLIVTQVVDENHPILGFFHRWIEEFAKHCEHVHVICLQEGHHSLPPNVTVHSLGKEEGKGRLQYLIRFYKLIWQLRHDYDQVFIHMNQIYVILGAPLWRSLGKRIKFWYMHGAKSWSLRLAAALAQVIYTGSRESFPLKSRKVVVTGHGIDTDHFLPRESIKTTDLVTVGRITASKNLGLLIEAVAELQSAYPVTLTIVGAPQTESERAYYEALQQSVSANHLENKIIFKGKLIQRDLPNVLGSAKVFVTAATNGSLDKAVLEAMAVGLPVVSMAPGTASLPLGSAQTKDKVGFVEELKKVLESGVTFIPEHVAYVKASHSLSALIPKLLA